MKRNPLIAISFCLNLALSGLAVHQLKESASSKQSGPAATISEKTTGPARSFPPAASNSPASVNYVSNHFGWSTVEADDFEQLATNLRAIGCPEKTVRDVVVARVRRGLERLSRSAGPKLSFWTAGLRRTPARCEAERVVAAARARMLASVDRALGPDVFTEDGKLMEDFVEQAIVRFLGGPMAEEKFSRLAVLFARQEARRKELHTRTRGVWLEEDEAVLNDLGRQFHRELAAVLLPAELEEFTARPAMMKLADQVRFEAMDLSPVEIREVALIRAQFDEPAMGELFDGANLTDQQEGRFASAVREFLGESRYAQFERARDRAFQTLFEMGRDLNLPPDTAVKVFELRQLTAQEVARLRENKSLSDAERQQQFALMQAQAQAGVSQVLGADACAQYLNRGGAWLTNVSGL